MQVQNGDLNWVLPGKLLAFAGPTAVSKVLLGYCTFTLDVASSQCLFSFFHMLTYESYESVPNIRDVGCSIWQGALGLPHLHTRGLLGLFSGPWRHRRHSPQQQGAAKSSRLVSDSSCTRPDDQLC